MVFYVCVFLLKNVCYRQQTGYFHYVGQAFGSETKDKDFLSLSHLIFLLVYNKFILCSLISKPHQRLDRLSFCVQGIIMSYSDHVDAYETMNARSKSVKRC